MCFTALLSRGLCLSPLSSLFVLLTALNRCLEKLFLQKRKIFRHSLDKISIFIWTLNDSFN